MKSSQIRSFVAGVLIANSAPHLATAVTGRRHFTPLAGHGSGPAVNAAWAGLNLAAGALLLWPTRRSGGSRWGGDLTAFETGCVAMAAWMAGSERWFPMNSDRSPRGVESS
ncbi:hypothetical protein [Microtetraspora malaysiensis]|uniref:hypothetical protein n=1 Tax=Microtetraspora malaysiensis TaxID=161358 RepID=UPI0012F84C0F|nr:hypothetical protein [Microtetraspora malaysiensis]